MVIADNEGRYLDANPAACELFGLPKELLLGHTAAEFAAPGFDFAAAWGAFRESYQERGEFHLVRPDGSVRQTEYNAVTNFLPGRHLSVMRDITERMQMEQERVRALYDLRERVKEATLLQNAGRTLSDAGRTVQELLEAIVRLIPPAWQYPDITAARITFGHVAAATPDFTPTPWTQQVDFHTKYGTAGTVEVVYLRERPRAVEGPFLAEERSTLDALAQMLQADLKRRQYERELQATATLSDALRGVQFRDEVLPLVLMHAQETLGAESTAIGMINEAAGEIVMESILGDWPEMEGVRMQPGEGVTGRVLASRQPFVTTDLAGATGFLRPDVVQGIYSAVCMPLIAESQPVGALWVVRSRPFAHDEIRLIEVIAESAASALHRAILYERVRAQAFRTRRLINVVDEGLILLDPDYQVLLANPAAKKHLTFLDPDVTVGSRLTQLGNLGIEQALGRTVSDASAHEITVGRREERLFQVEAHVLAEIPEGNGWVLVVRDETDKRKIQERVQQQDRLAAVGRFAAGIAHDFNNVIAAIVLNIQLLQQRSGFSETEQQRLQVIYTQANHGANLIRQILDFSRGYLMERRPVDLLLFLQGLVKLLRRTMPESIAIDLEFDGENAVVDANLTRLQQACMNLAINARDAMPNGGHLTLSLSHVRLENNQTPPVPEIRRGSWACITVADTGTGIPLHVLDRIFDPFVTTKEPGKGTGLGLSQVYGIIHQHGGHVSVESEVGQGTTFTVYLPLLGV